MIKHGLAKPILRLEWHINQQTIYFEEVIMYYNYMMNLFSYWFGSSQNQYNPDDHLFMIR